MKNWRHYLPTMKIGQKYKAIRKSIATTPRGVLGYFPELVAIERIDGEEIKHVRVKILKSFHPMYNFRWWLETVDELEPYCQTDQECLSEIIVNGNFSEELISRIRQLG